MNDHDAPLHANLADHLARKTEAEIAADLRRKMTEAIKPVIAVMEEGRAAGLMVGWQQIGTDHLGRFAMPYIQVTKVL